MKGQTTRHFSTPGRGGLAEMGRKADAERSEEEIIEKPKAWATEEREQEKKEEKKKSQKAKRGAGMETPAWQEKEAKKPDRE